MAVRAEPLRRRLTVGIGSDAPAGKGGPASSGDSKDGCAKVEQAGFAKIFEQAAAKGARAVSITSKTDSDLKRKRSFGDKDYEVLSNREGPTEDHMAWVKEMGIAWKCHKGLKPESPNQDSFSILIVEGEFALYCVYDGHGPTGHDVSDIARNELVKEFLARKDAGMSVEQSFRAAFVGTQKKFHDLTDSKDPGIPGIKSLDASMSGTTCTMAYHDMLEGKLFIAHVGDSRGVLGRRADGPDAQVEELTVDHKPNLPLEKERIEKAGGRVLFDGFYNHRVFAASGMYPGLNMSRALGDCIGHNEAGLSAVPDVKEIDLKSFRASERDQVLLLLCTDGVWEFVESKDAITLMMKDKVMKPELQRRLEEITQMSWDRWMQDSDNEISDDITGIAVIL